jgi:glyoxylase-like metal-dependent hydrolase (beta-lactamase superfamily II)
LLEVAPGILRATQRLPLGIDHVHVHFVRLPDGVGFLLVDTGLGLPAVEEWWRLRLEELDGPVQAIVVTHFHPDHVGGAAVARALTGAPVYEGTLDREQALRVWSDPAALDAQEEWFGRHGMPAQTAAAARADGEVVRTMIRLPDAPEPLHPGESVEGWEAVPLPGHADGQLGLHRDGVLLGGDALLADITPIVGLYPGARPDPLADFLGSLDRIAELAPRLVLPGHGDPIADARARVEELRAHHRERLAGAAACLDGGPLNAYEVSQRLWRQDFTPTLRRMAVAETLAHLERLVAEGRAARTGDDGSVSYTAR